MECVPEASVGALEDSPGSGSPDLMPCVLRGEYIAQGVCIHLNGRHHLHPISLEVSQPAVQNQRSTDHLFSPTAADPSMSAYRGRAVVSERGEKAG